MTEFNAATGAGTPYSGSIIGARGTAAKPAIAAGTLGSGIYSPSEGNLSVALSGVGLAFPVLGVGGTLLAAATAPSANGLVGSPSMSFLAAKNSDGTTLAASAAAGKFGLAITLGTSEVLLSEAANSNTKTDIAIWEVVLPPGYVAGTNITVTANCNYTLGSGTVGTHTLAMAAYLVAAAGTQGSTLIATAAQTVPASAGNVTFTITGTTLLPGSRLMLAATLVIQDTGGSNITAQINSVALS